MCLVLASKGLFSLIFCRQKEGGVRVCGIAVIFISKYGIAVFRLQALCGEFKFYVAVGGEKIVLSR